MTQIYRILTILLLLAITSCSTNKVFHKLDKKYEKDDYGKVMQKADRYIKKNPADPVPLYFKSLTHLHLYNQDKDPNELEAALKYLYRARRKTIPNYLTSDLEQHTQNLLQTAHSELSTIEEKTDPLTAQNIISYNKKIRELPNIKIAKGTLEKPTNNAVSTQNKPAKGVRKTIVKNAKKYIGVPYKYGGTTPRGFDCSGFTGHVYMESGINLPRTASQQASAGEKVREKQAEPGDLLFFTKTTTGGGITHVALILEVDDNGIKSIIHSTSKGVIINERNEAAWTSYWKPKMKSVATYIR